MSDNDKPKRKIMVAPSVLAADFGRLNDEVKAAEKAGADLLHLDIMDGHFVPNISYGPDIVKAISKIANMPLDVHLMITNPEIYISSFADAGADYITVHYEVANHLHKLIQSIKNLNIKAGVSLNPHSSASLIEEVIADIDMVLLISVNPGFGGQSFIENTIGKIKQVRKKIDDAGYQCLIEVDGGINDKTGADCVSAGADILVAGSYIFGSEDYAEKINSLRY